ncbi:MAG: RNA polymerase factor sigma-54 [Spirochaetes bacterium]|nr:RNA polymerase factor sigma-54 [Spirochaetota bacterium]
MAFLKLDVVQTQRLRLTQSLRQSLDLLQIPTLELEDIILQELEENPVLECDDSLDEGFESLDAATKTEIEGISTKEEYTVEYESEDTGSIEYEKKNVMEIVSQAETLQEHLLTQARMLELSPDEMMMLEEIITSLDDNGFLSSTIENLQKELGADSSKIQKLLHIIQTLDPVGCGATNVTDSLRIQAHYFYPDDILLQHIIKDYLPYIQRYEYDKVAKQLNISKEEVKEKAILLTTLTPYPGAHFFTRKPIYVRPDIEVQLIDGEVVINLVDDWMPKLYINARYIEMLKQKKVDEKTREFIHDKVNAAKNLINNISRRNETLLLVAYAIMNRQKDFLQKGPGFLKPLIYADLESELGFHESTIARAVANKYAQTKWGVFEFKYFFVKKIQSVHNDDTSSDMIMKRIKELVQNESKQNPLSDEEILDILKAEGIRIARRTIAKYRDLLSIPASHIRKKSYLIKHEGNHESNNYRQKF